MATNDVFQDRIDRARAVPIEDEVTRRGIKLAGRGSERAGPCPMCGGTDRFSINLLKGIWNCRGCQRGGDVIALVQHLDGCAFSEAVGQLVDERRSPGSRQAERLIANAVRRMPRHHDGDGARQIASSLRWFDEGCSIEDTIGLTYFERERKIFTLPPDVREVLRFHPRCVFGQDEAGQWLFRPCIIALLRDVQTNEPTGIHRIALNARGELMGRMALGRKKGSAIKLWGDAEVTTGLVVGEGVETVLAATAIEYRGTLLRPAWSLVDADNLQDFPVLPAIEHLTIVADADASNRGQDAARICAKRWAAAGHTVEVLIPDKIGWDFNDIGRRWVS
jgi:hypothetical protein